MNKTFLDARIREYFGTKTEFAKSLGIQLGSVTDWFTRGVIPSAKIDEVFDKLNITSDEDIEAALNLPKLEVCYRAKKRDLLEKEVPKKVQENIKRFSKTYFSLKSEDRPSSAILEIRNKIGQNRDVQEVASIIRQYLDLTDKTPFNFSSINYILEKYGINVFFVPFNSLSFNQEDEISPLAFTAQKLDQYLILCDSNRTFDEIYFDLTHELIHIFTGLVGGKPQKEVEDFIDAVAEELIYPKLFLEREFPFLLQADKGRITDKDFLDSNLRKLVHSSSFMAPRGIAKRLASLNLLNDRLKVYDWLYNDEHDYYLKFFGTSLTDTGKMNFDFSDADEFTDFIDSTVKKDVSRYPLYSELYNALLDGKITARAFGEMFGLDSGEVDEMRLNWLTQR